ncbi:Citrate lyase ligase [Snodgrassella alvi SCGC AB-598-O02]|nr:Citrate lyase ligase [Snodgrassella alvi SCGC AB-598-O02]
MIKVRIKVVSGSVYLISCAAFSTGFNLAIGKPVRDF